MANHSSFLSCLLLPLVFCSLLKPLHETLSLQPAQICCARICTTILFDTLLHASRSFVQSKQAKLANSILRVIEHQRRHYRPWPRQEGRRLIVFLRLDQSDTNKACLDMYKEHFEVPFIDTTEKDYKRESESFLTESSVSDYLSAQG